MLTIAQINNLREAGIHARKCEEVSKVPALLILSLWAQHSNWGSYSPGCNCYMIPAYPNCLGRQLLYTRCKMTPTDMLKWLNEMEGRSAMVENGDPDSLGRIRYLCEDWFATFPTLFHCFMKKAGELHSLVPLTTWADYYKTSNFVSLMHNIGPLISTDNNYTREILTLASIQEVMQAAGVRMS